MGAKERKHGPPYRVPPGPDVDLQHEDVRDSKGARIDADYVERAVEDVHRVVGRPSLTAPGRRSPQIAVRLPEAIRAAVAARAEREGKSVSELAREAIEAYLEA